MPGEIYPVYLDTSCALKLFLENEAGSLELKNYLKQYESISFLSSSIISLEYHSAIRRKLKNHEISKSDYLETNKVWNDFEDQMLLKPVSNAILDDSKKILMNTKVKGRVRSLDCIHFATYKLLQDAFPKTVLISSDTTLCELAKEAKLKYFNPIYK